MTETIQTGVGTGNALTVLYILLSLVVSAYLANSTDKKIAAFIILFWLIAQPIIDGFYRIHIPGLPFNLLLNRFLLIYLLAVYLWAKLQGKSKPLLGGRHSPRFIVYLFVFFGCVVVSMLVNKSQLDIKRVIAIPLESLTFIMLFLVAREIVTARTFKTILQCIILVAVINAVVSIIQVAIDPYFLRIGEMRAAFGNVYRSYGVLPTEYIMGGFQLMAIYVVMGLYDKGLKKNAIMLLLLISIITTFHRMDLIVLIVTMGIYFTFYSKRKYGIAYITIGIVATVITITGYQIFKSSGGSSQLVEQRLSVDTVSGRFDQFGLVIGALPKYPLGLGNYDAQVYQTLMLSRGHSKSVLMPNGFHKRVGLGVHNGFLGVGIQYGILAMLAFIGMLGSMFLYFNKRAKRNSQLTIIPLFSVLIWILINLSNGIIVFSSYNILVVGLISGLFVGAYQKGILNSQSDNSVTAR